MPTATVRRPILLLALAIILALEALLSTGVTVWLVVELLTAQASSFDSAIGVLLLSAGLSVALWAMVAGVLRRSSWVRGAAITWQLMQIAVAVGCFQGIFAVPSLGWALLVPAVVAILLLMSPPVVAATRRVS
ncbi:hypothetical protein [Agreia sp. COWG]|uniref:hypothetical protein n=1 Tax=Agreia sp. COWG TaxID=2773266 RepID=UPI001F360364|nr:hypothetical protein [Agreia sp. COWG]